MKTRFVTLAVALAAAALLGLALDAGAADTELRPVSKDGVLVFASEDDQFRWWLDARINLDGSFFVEDRNSLGDGVQVRRLRIGLKSILWGDYYAELDVDFAEEATALKDAYIRYDGLFGRTGYVRAGNFRQPFGLEENTTSRNLMFPERSQGLDGFVPGRKMGLEVAKFAPHYRVAGSLYGPDVEEFETEDQDMTWNMAARVNANALRTEHSVLHLGLAGTVRQPQFETTTFQFRTRNEQHVNNYKYVDTGNIPGLDDFSMVDGELAAVYKRVRVQAEHTNVGIQRIGNRPELSMSGGYVCASVFLTPDSHPYEWDTAEFGRLVPASKRGALELVTRYSYVDMTDEDVRGGESTAFTVGANWYMNANVRLYMDYVMVDNDRNANANGKRVGDDDYQFLTFRLQAAF